MRLLKRFVFLLTGSAMILGLVFWGFKQNFPGKTIADAARIRLTAQTGIPFEIQDNLQLNVLTNVQKGTEGVKVGLDKLKLDDLLSMLYRLENHRPVLRTSHLNISISPGSRQIRASFQVHKQQRD